MKIGSVILVVVIALVWPATMFAQTKPSVRSDMIVIDGSKNPQDLPEDKVWAWGFRRLALDKAKNLDSLGAVLQLSKEDSDKVFKAAEGQTSRDSACEKEQTDYMANNPNQKPDEQGAGLHAILCECRRRDLEGRDLLLPTLSDEGQIALSNWIVSQRKGLIIYVPKLEYEWFKNLCKT